jgi:WD40 repeat protein
VCDSESKRVTMASFDGTHVPDEIYCGEQVFDLVFHPHSDVLGVALIDGRIQLHKYGPSGVASEKVMELNHHSLSCRGITFSNDGQQLYSISSDRSWAQVDANGQMVAHFQNGHQSSINKLLLLEDKTLVTGDDAGVVKLWDTRMQKEAQKYHLHEDYISDFAYNEARNTLLSVGGDATLCAYDLRKKNDTSRSDDQEAELQCVQCIKGGRKVICGTQEGVILTFSWDRWGDCSDRFPGHPQAVDSMLKVDENSVITGSSDGLIRVVSLQPNKVLGVIGDHEDFPVEGVCRSRCGGILGSYSHDDIVRFWDISMFVGDVDDSGADYESEEDGEKDDQKMTTGDDEEDEGEDEENWEDASDSSGEDGGKLNPGDISSSDEDSDDEGGGMVFKSETEKFYEDL